jgi:methyltransferase family protein
MRLTHLPSQHVDLSGHRPLPFISDYTSDLEERWNTFASGIGTRLRRKFVLVRQGVWRAARAEFSSAQTFAVNACAPGRHVLYLGIGAAKLSGELKRKLCHVKAITLPDDEAAVKSRNHGLVPAPHLPKNVRWFDQILLMDLIEHLHDPETFLKGLRTRMARGGSEVIITAANAAFVMRRMLLALSSRNEIRKGNFNINHRRAFTFKSMRALLERAGYEVMEASGVPAPFPVGRGRNRWTRALPKLNRLLLKIAKQSFAYEICIRARPVRAGSHSFEQTIADDFVSRSRTLRRVA